MKHKKKLPFVSICTPTFNRRPFFPSAIKCVLHQDYPKNKIEWVIVDDGTDKIEDLVKDLDFVKYVKLDQKLTLGKKRNLMHEHCKGDIIVYMDDDDYYPPTRISHAVKKLTSQKECLIAGSSQMYIYFKHNGEMWKLGPYAKYHATAGTFAFKKELLEITKYTEEQALSEEKDFLKNYTIPLLQLDPKHVILVFSHNHNTFDKRKLLKSAPNKFVQKSDKKVDEFIKDKSIKKWFLEDIDKELENYDLGLPKHKPDVMIQLKEKEKLLENMNMSNLTALRNGKQVRLTNKEVLGHIKALKSRLESYEKLFNSYREKLKTEINKNKELQKFYDEYKDYFKNGKILGPEK